MEEKIVLKDLDGNVAETLTFNCPHLYYESYELDEVLDLSLAVKVFYKKEEREPYIGFNINSPHRNNAVSFGLRHNTSDDMKRDFQLLSSWWKRALHYKNTGKDVKGEVIFVSPSNGQF